MDRAISPQLWGLSIPGALPQAGMVRAFGPPEIPRIAIAIRKQKAPKARTISAWGSAPGNVKTKRNKGCKPAPSFHALGSAPGYRLLPRGNG